MDRCYHPPDSALGEGADDRGGARALPMKLLEREDMLATIAEQQRLAALGAGRIVFVEGEAGIGKTSLLRECATRLDGAADVYWGACDALQTPRPLAPLHDIASQASPGLRALLEGDAPRLRAFGAFLELLSRTPALVLLEDLHWADEATLDLLRYVGRRIPGTKSLLLATYRSDEVGPTHPLRRLLGDLATSGAQRLAPRPLSLAAVQELAGDRAVDAAALHRATGGNPFFVTEVLATDGEGVPATVRDAVLGRAARLRPSARAILDAAAVAGPRVEPWLLEELVAAESESIEECLASGVLCAQADVFTFRHELARQAILQAMTPTRRQSLHRLVLQSLRAKAATRCDVARLAHHAEAAGDATAVLEFAPAAAREAAAKGAHRQAAEQWARALRQPVERAVERAEMLDAYAWELQLGGRVEESVAARREAIELWRAAGDAGREAISHALLAGCLVGGARNAEGEAALGAALALVGPDAETPAATVARRASAYLRMLDRDVEQAIGEGRVALALAERHGDLESVVQALNTIGSALIVAGRLEEGRPQLERSLALAERAALDTWVANALGNLGSGSGEIFRFDVAEPYLRRGIEYCAERDLDASRYYQTAWLALVLLYRGRWEESSAAAHAVLAARGANAIARLMALIALGRVRARRGDPGTWEALDAARELASQSGTLQRVAPMLAARAEARWLERRDGDGAGELGGGLELALHKRHAWFTAELLFWQARVTGAATTPVPAYCADIPFALELAGRWREAAAAWEARGCPYEQARALSLGDEAAKRAALTLLEALGARPFAEQLRHELRAAGARGLRRGPRGPARGHPAGLTAREVAVLALLCEGLRNKDIAQRLHRSVRTIDHHVAAIFAKLGATNRAEAVSAAHRLGLTGEAKPATRR